MLVGCDWILSVGIELSAVGIISFYNVKCVFSYSVCQLFLVMFYFDCMIVISQGVDESFLSQLIFGAFFFCLEKNTSVVIGVI